MSDSEVRNEVSTEGMIVKGNREASKYNLDVIVSDPQKHNSDSSSSSSYVTYQVSTRTNNETYIKNAENYNDKKKKDENDEDANEDGNILIVVHRRFSDFELLYNILVNDYPTCIIPPLPNKKIFQYIAGDRFSNSFTQKRCHSLQNFLKRVCKHPMLNGANILEFFLISSDWEVYKKKLSSNFSNVMHNNNKEEMTEVIMNAFKTVHNQNEVLVEIKKNSEKFENNIVKIDKIFSKITKKNDVIIEDYFKMNLNFKDLEELLTDQDNDEQLKEQSMNNQLAEKFKIFNNGIINLSYSMNDLNKFYTFDFLTDMKDLEQYINSLKNLMKLKDQKQIDYEELSEYLTKSINEKNHLISGYPGGNPTPEEDTDANNTKNSSNINKARKNKYILSTTNNFITNKLEEIAGFNQEQMKRDKIKNLETKIENLTNEVKTSKQINEAFETECIDEIKLFETIKNTELKDSLNNLIDHNIKFYESMTKTWQEINTKLQQPAQQQQ